MWPFKCRHVGYLKVFRAHKRSCYGLDQGDKAVVVDKNNLLVFIRCGWCGKFVDVDRGLEPFDKLTLAEEREEKRLALLERMSREDRELLGL